MIDEFDSMAARMLATQMKHNRPPAKGFWCKLYREPSLDHRAEVYEFAADDAGAWTYTVKARGEKVGPRAIIVRV